MKHVEVDRNGIFFGTGHEGTVEAEGIRRTLTVNIRPLQKLSDFAISPNLTVVSTFKLGEEW